LSFGNGIPSNCGAPGTFFSITKGIFSEAAKLFIKIN
jgi:hypothetical protein